jgi:hypothetical protein
MKDLDPAVFVAVFREMFGVMYLPMVALFVLGAGALIVAIVKDGGINGRRLIRAEIAGLAGGFAGIALLLWLTRSSLADALGGPIDWLLLIAVWTGGAIVATCVAYIALGLLGVPDPARERSSA